MFIHFPSFSMVFLGVSMGEGRRHLRRMCRGRAELPIFRRMGLFRCLACSAGCCEDVGHTCYAPLVAK